MGCTIACMTFVPYTLTDDGRFIVIAGHPTWLLETQRRCTVCEGVFHVHVDGPLCDHTDTGGLYMLGAYGPRCPGAEWAGRLPDHRRPVPACECSWCVRLDARAQLDVVVLGKSVREGLREALGPPQTRPRGRPVGTSAAGPSQMVLWVERDGELTREPASRDDELRLGVR